MKFQKTKNLFRLGSRGVSHYIVPLIIVIGMAVIGTAFLVASHADPVSETPVASASSNPCGSRKKLVNATPSEYRKYSRNGTNINYMSGMWNGMRCISSSNDRQAVTKAGTNMTIIWMSKCPSGHVFAYDSKNPDGNGYKAAKWRFQTRLDGQNKTMYCIQKKILGKCVNTNGNTEGVRNAFGCKVLDSARVDDRHVYQFVKPFGSACDARSQTYTGCKANQFFVYAFMKNTTRYN